MKANHIIAITGPSMAGKTTLTNKLVDNYDFVVPKHITTREKRLDDLQGFYKYLKLEDFIKLKERGELLLYSGAGDRYYGILKEDCEKSFAISDKLLINISYKDILQYINMEYSKMLITLTYRDILIGMINRNLLSDRAMPQEELYKRIIAAQQDHANYFNMVKENSDCVIYTDEKNEEETFRYAKKIVKKLY